MASRDRGGRRGADSESDVTVLAALGCTGRRARHHVGRRTGATGSGRVAVRRRHA
eukprot:gene34608-57413_t